MGLSLLGLVSAPRLGGESKLKKALPSLSSWGAGGIINIPQYLPLGR